MMVFNTADNTVEVRPVTEIVSKPKELTAKEKEQLRESIEQKKEARLRKEMEANLTTTELPATLETATETTTTETTNMKRSFNLTPAAQSIVDDFHTYGAIVTVPLVKKIDSGYECIRHAEVFEAAEFLQQPNVNTLVWDGQTTTLTTIEVDINVAPSPEPEPEPEIETVPEPTPVPHDVIASILSRLDRLEDENKQLRTAVQETRTQLRMADKPAPTVAPAPKPETKPEPETKATSTTKAAKQPKVTKQMISALNVEVEVKTGKKADLSKYNMKSSVQRTQALSMLQDILTAA
jgi:hypothetical protein